MTLVSIIIITFNPGKLIIDCLNSIKNSNYHAFEVIIVDNNSIDNSINAIKDSFKFIHIIHLNHNIGYGAAANLGINQAKGGLIIIMNQDIIVNEDWLINLVRAYKNNGVAIYQPKILRTTNPNVISSAGNLRNLAAFPILRGSGMSSKLFNKTEELHYASGACFMIPKTIIKTIGLFDPAYFMYAEDLDLGWRALLFGYKLIYVPPAIVYHGIHRLDNLKFKIYYSERNRLLTIFKNYSRRTLLILVPYLILNEFFISGYFIIKGFMTIKIRSYIDCYRLLPHFLKERRKIKALRKKSDAQIVKKFANVNGYHPIYSSDQSVINSIAKSITHFVSSVGRLLVKFI